MPVDPNWIDSEVLVEPVNFFNGPRCSNRVWNLLADERIKAGVFERNSEKHWVFMGMQKVYDELYKQPRSIPNPNYIAKE